MTQLKHAQDTAEATERASTTRAKIGGLAYSLRIAVAGNPNSGKTTLFNRITGAHQHVGNYSGVTVEKKEGILRHNGREIILLDLPGTYSLSAYSPEERIASETLLSGTEQAVLYVADAGLLERSLLLAVQIREMGLPMVLACNMMDEVQALGKTIDFAALSERMGATALPTVGVRGEGIHELFTAVERAATRAAPPPIRVPYGPLVDPFLEKLETLLTLRFQDILRAFDAAGSSQKQAVPARWVALMLLENNPLAWEAVERAGEEAVAAITDICDAATRTAQAQERRIEDIIAVQRFHFCQSIIKDCLQSTGAKTSRMQLSDRLDRVLAHSFFGALVMIAILYGIFTLVIELGAYPQEWLETAFSLAAQSVREILPHGFVSSLVADGIIDGLGGVLSFVPLIIILFFLIAILEDSGYMARMAYIADRLFHLFGLHGTSVMPYIIAGGIAGGCAIPGVMATRTMSSPMEKLATMLTLPSMTCGAKLPVVLLLAGTFFPNNTANVLFCVVLVSWLVAFLTALLLRHTLLRGSSTPLVLEMPPYRWPSLRTIVIHAMERTWMYMRKAVVVLLPVSILLWASMTFPSLPIDTALEFEKRKSAVEQELAAPNLHDDQRKILEEQLDAIDREQEAAALRNSIAGKLGVWLEQYTEPIGFTWRTDVALIGGIAAKEAIVSTLATAYSLGNEAEDAPLSAVLKRDPTWNPAVALSLLVFVLLYSPCFVTLVVIRQESGSWKWVAFSLLFNTTLAYGAALLLYQTRHWWESFL